MLAAVPLPPRVTLGLYAAVALLAALFAFGYSACP